MTGNDIKPTLIARACFSEPSQEVVNTSQNSIGLGNKSEPRRAEFCAQLHTGLLLYWA